MKNAKVLFFVLVFGVVFFGYNGSGGVYAQSSNNEQRIIGTWEVIKGFNSAIFHTGKTLVFKSDGTVSITPTPEPGRIDRFGITADKIIGSIGAYYYAFSPDGKTLVVADVYGNYQAVLQKKS